MHLVPLGEGVEEEAWQLGVEHHHTSLVVAMATWDQEEVEEVL